jgi:hypothetical protein
VQVGTTCHSWFVPNTDARPPYSSCLNYSDSLRLTVLADAMFYPAGGDSVHPGPALSTEEAALHARLGEIAEIVRFIQSSVRSDPETRGLRVRDRLEILRITQEALRGGPGAAGRRRGDPGRWRRTHRRPPWRRARPRPSRRPRRSCTCPGLNK